MNIITNFKLFVEKKEFKSIEMKDNFFNKVCSALDKKYFPDVKYYRDDENDTKVHANLELFNNGVLGYGELIKRLAKFCKDSEKNIHEIVKKHIESFGDFDTKIFESKTEKPEPKYGKGDKVHYLPKLSGFNNKTILVVKTCKWKEEDELEKALGVESEPTYLYTFEDSNLAAIEDDLKPVNKKGVE